MDWEGAIGTNLLSAYELPKYCDEKGNVDLAKLDHLMPWAEELPEECRKLRRL